MKLSWFSFIVIAALSTCANTAWVVERLEHLLMFDYNQTANIAAPEFSLTTFEGREITLSDFRGQVVVVNFWAGWCPPCELEAPILESLWQHYRDRGVIFIGIAYADYEPASIRYIEEHGITYLNGSDPQAAIADLFRVRGIPETLIIDQEGNIVYHIVSLVTERELIDSIEALLPQP